MNARISQLHMTEAEWSKLATFVPKPGEFIVYDPDENYPYSRIKIGDGNRKLHDLDFFVNSVIDIALKPFEQIDGGRITEYLKKD